MEQTVKIPELIKWNSLPLSSKCNWVCNRLHKWKPSFSSGVFNIGYANVRQQFRWTISHIIVERPKGYIIADTFPVSKIFYIDYVVIFRKSKMFSFYRNVNKSLSDTRTAILYELIRKSIIKQPSRKEGRNREGQTPTMNRRKSLAALMNNVFSIGLAAAGQPMQPRRKSSWNEASRRRTDQRSPAGPGVAWSVEQLDAARSTIGGCGGRRGGTARGRGGLLL